MIIIIIIIIIWFSQPFWTIARRDKFLVTCRNSTIPQWFRTCCGRCCDDTVSTASVTHRPAGKF